MSFDIRPISADELEKFQRTMGVPFFVDPTPSMRERFAEIIDVDRLRAAFDGEQMIATFGAFSLQMTVPGAVLPAAGTTVVTVLPTHRRQGLLRKLMTQHLQEVRERGEPLAALWASETSIYGRFGYGIASERAWVKLHKSDAKLREPVDIQGSIRLIDRNEALRVFPSIFAKAARQRPGTFERTPAWWEHRALADAEEQRLGGTEHRRALHLRDGEPVGYVLYRTRTDLETFTTHLMLIELIGVDAEAERALWQFILNIDLYSTLSYWNQPIDDPLRWWLEHPRKLERKTLDGIWVRPVDIAQALAGRRYSAPGTLVFHTTDELCPWNNGTFQLTVAPDGTATCNPTTATPELQWTPTALGSIYLAGYRVQDLAKAGAIKGTPESLRKAEALFTWHPQPWCPELF